MVLDGATARRFGCVVVGLLFLVFFLFSRSLSSLFFVRTLDCLIILPEDPQDHRREHRSSSGVPNEGCSGTPLVERCSGIVSVLSVSSSVALPPVEFQIFPRKLCPTCAFGRVRLCPSCAFGALCRSNLRILCTLNLPGTLPAMAHGLAAAALPDYDVMRMVVPTSPRLFWLLLGTRKLVVLHKVLGTGVSLGKIASETLRSTPGVLGHRDILESLVGRAVKFRDVSGWRCGWCLRGGPCWCLVLVSLVRRFRPQPLRQNKLTVPTASQEEGCEYRRRRLSLEICVLFVACGDGCGGPRRGGS